jgi:hypothetical protein
MIIRKGKMPKKIDWELAARIAATNCPITDIAAIMQLSTERLRARCKRDLKVPLAEWVNAQRSHYRNRLREAQIEVALRGNPTMLIWLGKQHLGQMDKMEKIDKDWAKKQDKGELLALAEKAMAVVKQAAQGAQEKK